MALVTGRLWECDVCGYRWIYVDGRYPDQCRNSQCRSRRWNHTAKLIRHHKRNDNKPKPIDGTPVAGVPVNWDAMRVACRKCHSELSNASCTNVQCVLYGAKQ